MIAIALKSIVAIALALAFVAAARRSRASVRHLILASLFAFLLLLPLVQQFAPSVAIPVQDEVIREATGFSAVPPVLAARAPKPATLDWRIVYAAGVVVMSTWLLIGVLRLRRIVSRAEVWREGVVLSDEVTGPLTFGATIVLPRGATRWPEDELARALRHELEHVRRRDWLLQIIARATVVLYWPNPLVWMAWRRFRLEAERACDDAVVGSFAPSAYAAQLVALSRVHRLTTIPALGMATRSKLAQRVEAILDATQPRGPHGRPATIAAIVVMLALLVSVAPARFIEAASWEDDLFGRARGEMLVKAAELGQIDIVERLLDDGMDVNTRVHGDGSALIGAARGGHIDLIQVLLDRGADINLGVSGDGNALIAAANSGQIEAVRYLLDAGASIDEVVPGDENALIGASERGHLDVVRLLITRGADVNARVVANNDEIRTPLRMARRRGHAEVESVLVGAGARE